LASQFRRESVAGRAFVALQDSGRIGIARHTVIRALLIAEALGGHDIARVARLAGGQRGAGATC